jgi:hypothetical protein
MTSKRENVEMMDKLLEKYPDAFKSMILEDGTKIILQKPSLILCICKQNLAYLDINSFPFPYLL